MSTQSKIIPWVMVVCRCGQTFAVGMRKDEKNPGLDTIGATWRCGNPECKTTYRSGDILARLDRWDRAEFGNLFGEAPVAAPVKEPPISAYDQKLRE